MKKLCYIINFYLGNRRYDIDLFKTDNLCYLKGQIETLEKYKHSISKIIFNFNVDKTQYDILSNAINIIPKNIQESEVEINIRQNYGMSYGAWSDMFMKHIDEYEYYMFNEDDIFIVQDNFDDYLINKLNSLPNCGYLCGLVRRNGPFPVHGGFSSGISSLKCLKDVANNFGCLPHSRYDDYASNEMNGQVTQTNVIHKMGYELYDIRDDYRLRMWMNGHIYNYFVWKDKDLFLSAKIYYNEQYKWIDSIENEYLKISTIQDSIEYYKYQ